MDRVLINTAALSCRTHKAREHGGFTLPEILVTLAIIGILAVIAIPLYLGQKEKAARTEASENLQSIRLIMEQYYSENGCYYAPCTTLTDQAVSGVTAIMSYLPSFKPGNANAMKFNYNIAITNNRTQYVIGAVLKGNSVSSGATCASGELKIDHNNNKCGF